MNYHPVETVPSYSLNFSIIDNVASVLTGGNPSEEIIEATKVSNITRVRELLATANSRWGDEHNNTALH